MHNLKRVEHIHVSPPSLHIKKKWKIWEAEENPTLYLFLNYINRVFPDSLDALLWNMQWTMQYFFIMNSKMSGVYLICREGTVLHFKNTGNKKKQAIMTIPCKILSYFNSKNNLNFYNLILGWAETCFDIKTTFGKRPNMKHSNQKIM